jgi:parvulin-like peptidyl-prolyl isomerase
VRGQNFAPLPTQGWDESESAAEQKPVSTFRIPAMPVSNVVASGEPAAPDISDFTFFEAGELIAVIGEEMIVAGDLMPFIEGQLKEIAEQAPKDQMEMIREKLMRQVLGQLVQSKMLSQFFMNEQLKGKPLNERADAAKQMETNMTKAFHEEVVPHMMGEHKVDTALELDRILRDEGTSLSGQFRVFKITAFGQEALRKYVPKKFDIHLDEMREYYETNMDSFRRPARVKFRELVALYAKCSSVDEAHELIAKMGNEILYGGTSFEATAKKMSHGPRAADGGLYDWVTQGSLKSKKVDEVIFSIPLRRLSLIIEDTDGFKIVEVLEREVARTIPFEEAQVEITKKLTERKTRKARDELLAKLKSEISVWSKWPEDLPNARPLSELSELYRTAEINPNE